MPQLTNLSVHYLSLVKTPATGKGLTLKSVEPGQHQQVIALTKTNDEQMVAYGIVYAPNQEDSHGDFADEETIRKAAHEFMRQERLKNIDTEHTFQTEDAYVVESWLLKSGDGMFPDEPAGAWAVGIKVNDPDTWQQLKSGELTGISLAGVASVKPDPNEERPEWVTSKSGVPVWFANLVKNLTPKPIEETEMNENQVRKLVKDEVGDAVKEALKSAGIGEVAPAAEPAAPAPQPAPVQKTGDEVDVKALLKAGFDDLVGKIDDKIAAALAKGAGESGAGTPQEETFL